MSGIYVNAVATFSEGAAMVSVDDRATGPHSSESRAADHERLVLEPRDVEFDWTNLPFHYVLLLGN